MTTIRRCTCRRADELTDVELRIVVGVANGEALHDIARAVHHTPSTVATYVSRARGKLGAATRAHLVTKAFEQNLIEFSPIGRVVAAGQARRAS